MKDRIDGVRPGTRQLCAQRQRLSVRIQIGSTPDSEMLPVAIMCTQSHACHPVPAQKAEHACDRQLSSASLHRCHAVTSALACTSRQRNPTRTAKVLASDWISSKRRPWRRRTVTDQTGRGARSIVGVEGHVVELQCLNAAILAAHLFGVHVQRNVINQLLYVRLAILGIATSISIISTAPNCKNHAQCPGT